MTSTGPSEIDVLVIGGGPAGTTTAALLARHNPGLRVALAEQSAFPRHHIGESLVIEVNRILRDMGALDRVAQAGFLKKGGATFVWGRDREPWSLRFHEGRRVRPGSVDVGPHTWHVERGRYDAILVETARAHGVTVHQPSRVTDVEVGGGGQATLVDESGRETVYRARFVVDAGGRNGPLARRVGKRLYDPILRNVAVYGYWRGAALEERYSGDWDLSLISVVATPLGWIWYIPVAPGVVSVGAVTSHATYGARVGTQSAAGGSGDATAAREALYREMLAGAPEVTAWLSRAERVTWGGVGPGLLVESDFNYTHSVVAGEGWALVGDAAGFVDPLFSIGVFLSQTAGQLLAYTIGTALDPSGGVAADRLLSAYDHHLRGYLGAFRSMAYVFYGFNATKEDWWRETRELVRSEGLPHDIDDRDAFIALTFGFGVNVALFQEAIACFGHMAAPKIRDALLGHRADPVLDLRADDRPRLAGAFECVPSAVPVEGSGRMAPMTRVELAPRAGGPAHAAFPRYFYVPDALAELVARIDGTRTVDAWLREADARAEGRPLGRHVLKALAGFGALE